MKYAVVSLALVGLIKISRAVVPDSQLVEVSSLNDFLEEIPSVTNCSGEWFGIGKRCSDRTKVEICLNAKPFVRVKCEEPRPVCEEESGSCVPPGYKDAFRCPRANGYYPKPGHCHHYFICVNGVAFEQDCPKGTVYEDKIKSCSRKSSCKDFPCSGKAAGTAVSYTGNQRFYTICDGIGASEIFDCGDDHNVFMGSGNGCRLMCVREENIPAWNDPTSLKYYECSRSDSYNFNIVTRWCPEGSVFDSDSRRCETKPPLQKAQHAF